MTRKSFTLTLPIPPITVTNGYGQPFVATEATWHVFAAPSDGRILADAYLTGASIDASTSEYATVDGLTVLWPANATPPAWTGEAFANFLREVSS